jgi:predicted amidohydrolase YtcJ
MSVCSVTRAVAATCAITTLGIGAAAPSYADDLIIHGGNILTMVGDEPTYVEALVIDDGRIAFVGSVADAMKLKTADTVVKELGGKTLLPGFIDSHSHFIDSLSLADRVNVSAPPVGPANNADEIVVVLKDAIAARGLAAGELLLGYGYDENLMPAGRPLSRDILDAAFPDDPVAVIHVSMHGAVLNSKAFEKFGYTDGMPTPAGGVILRKEGSQDLQGLVMETAYLPMFSNMPSPTEDTEVAAAKAGQMLYAAAGVTTAQEGATHANQIEQLKRVAKADGLYIDVVAYPFILDLDKVLEANPVETFGAYDKHLKLGGCKLTPDGSPQGKTAWFTTSYLTGGPAGEKDWKGEPGLPVDLMLAGTKKCYDAGLQVLFHANGDAAIDFLLEAHEHAAGGDLTKDRRTVGIHSQFIRPDQIAKYKEYGIVPAFFTDHTFFFADTHILNRGRTQTDFISPMKSAYAAGLQPTNHTDAFVVPIDQMLAMWTAVNRVSRDGEIIGAEQRISPYLALKAITINAAYQYFEEDSKGSLEVGKRADLVVLSDNPVTVDPMAIKDIKVIETIKDGKIVFQAQ